MEDDNGRAVGAVNEAPEEVGHVGHARAGDRREHAASEAEDEQVGDVPGAKRRELAVAGSVVGVGAAEEGAVAESGRVEPAGGGVHQQV